MTGFIDAATASINGVFPGANVPADSVSSSKADSAASGATSTATSAGTQASTADSKATSGVTATSVADSKAVSVSVNTSTADSKATSSASRASVADSKALSVSTLTSTADSKGVSAGTAASTADSKALSAAAAASSDLVYVGTAANTAINSLSDVQIVSRNVTSVGTTDKLDVTADFVILNASGAGRAYVITLDFDGLFDVEFTTGSLANSATLMHPFTMRGMLDIRANNLCYATFVCEGQLAAGIASGTDTTMAATHLRAHGWGTSTSDASSTTTVTLHIRSANATATQTCRLHNFQIRKATPT